ncbi:MAG TPA: hypothetical protein VE990_07880 [Acidimicrobiales bacterium]|nr:hypothetical protein [Acidimicrobiales bacterium]
MHGGRDRIGSVVRVKALAARVPNLTLPVVPDVSHNSVALSADVWNWVLDRLED